MTVASRITARPQAIIFDWDNTLVDSWGCIHRAINATLVHMGHGEWTLEETIARTALSMRDHFPMLFGERWEEARDFFYAYFRSIHIEYLVPLPGAAAMLAEFHAQGIYLGVVSNKNGAFLREESAHLGWDRFFGRLVGATDAAADKPAPDPVRMVLEGSGIAPEAAVWFVGDAPVDMHCAANSGCVPVLVRRRAPQAGEFDSHPPQHHCDDCEALAGLVRQLSVPISRI